jgi:hypothetical protein
MYISEYDAFGPWVYEIDDKHPMPQNFKGHIDLTRNAKMMIKIPVNEERRKMRPDMVLYDQIVCVHDSHLELYRYAQGEITVKQIPYAEMEAIETDVSLLRGIVRFYTTTGIHTFRYNNVSEEIISKLTSMLRERIATPIEDLQIPRRPSDDDLTYFTMEIWKRIKKLDGNIHIVAYQPETAISRSHQSLFVKIIGKLFSSLLPDALFMHNTKELVVISRAGRIRYSSSNHYNYSLSYFPLNQICSIEKESMSQYENIVKLSIKTSSNIGCFYVDKSNAEFEFINQLSLRAIPS